jgi:hypothetical protein
MSKSSKLLTQVGSVAALCFIFIGFQNCGKKMNFSSSAFEQGLKDSTIVQVPDDTSDDNPGDVVDDPTDDNPGDIVDDPVDTPPGDIVDDPVDHGNANGNSGNNDNSGEPSDDVDSGPQHFICIVDGPGKSQKLALVNNALTTQTSAVKTVCTTEKACLEIASQKFSVKSAEFRGFCKQDHDCHSVHLSESQLQDVINNSK